MSRLGRSQPVQPFAAHGFSDPGPGPVGTTPPPVDVVPLIDERRRQIPTPPPIVISGARLPTAAPAVFPPEPVVVPADQRRPATVPPEVIQGFDNVVPPEPTIAEPDDRRRLRPSLDPFTSDSVLAAVAAPAVTAPPRPTVVEADNRRRPLTPDPVALDGTLAGLPAPEAASPPPPTVVPFDERRRRVFGGGMISVGYPSTDTPPPPVSVDRADQRTRYRTPDPIVLSGSAALAPAPVVVSPPQAEVVENDDRRRRITLDPVSVSGVKAPQPAPSVIPPGPFVVPLEERRRFLAAIPPETSVGFDNVVPPRPDVAEPERARQKPPDPTAISGARLGATPQLQINPPGPFVVPLDERRRILERLVPPTVKRGFVGNIPANGVLPPGPRNLDRADQRARYLPEKTLVLSGARVPTAPPPTVTVNPGTDWAGEMSTW